MVMNISEKWFRNYELAKKYYEYYGNLDIHRYFKTIDGYTFNDSGFKLGTWVITQKKLYHQGKLSEDKIIEIDKPYWIKVSPIEWLIDYDTKTVISKKILIAGIQFNQRFGKFSYDNSFIYKYLNEIFVKDIIPSKIVNNQKEVLSDNDIKILRRLYRDLADF